MTLQEAIEIIEQQKKYIRGNPLLLESYNVLIKYVKEREGDTNE